MNKILKYLVLIITLFIGCNVYAESLEYINESTNYKALIEDDADLLTDSEEQLLLEQMKKLTTFGHAIFKSISENNTSAVSYSESYYYNNFGNNNGSLFFIDMDNRKIIISSGGANSKIITTGKANIITDNVYKYATWEQYYNCASKAFEQIDTLLNNGKIAEPMRHTSNIVIALISAFFINFFIVLKNSTTKKAKNKEIVDGANVEFDIGEITGTKIGTHKVYNPPSSSSSGGSSGGGGGGGGGFSGSSGGHGF
jgi:uncharacterized protein